jgi:colicin import membrane protein
MRASSPGAIALSAVLHAAVIGAIVAASFWVHKATEINPAMFDWVNAEDLEIGDHFEMPGALSKNPGVKEGGIRFNRPKVKRQHIPTQKELDAAQAKAEAQEAKETAARAKQSKSDAPSTTASARNKTTSYADFAKQNSKQLAANQKTRSGGSSKGATAAGIDAKGIVDELMESAGATAGPRGDGGGTGGSKYMIAALDAYFNRLVNAVRAAWEMPDSVTDLLVAKVSFHLGADGSITQVKIVKSSGSTEYDDSVIEAFQRVRSIGAVPGAKAGTYVFNFKMTE